MDVTGGRSPRAYKGTNQMKYIVTNIDWDTSDYDPCDPCDANVPDLPDRMLAVVEGEFEDIEGAISRAILRLTGFYTNGFDVADAADADEDDFDMVLRLNGR